MDYEEYMRNVLGYQPIKYDNTYNMNYNMVDNYMLANNDYKEQELESCYPDIYKIVYPVVQKVCAQNTGNITRDLVDRMTDEVYFAVEDKEMLKNRNKEEKQNISEEKRKISKNQSLNDLIRILILRELLVKHKLDNFYRNRKIQNLKNNLFSNNIFEQHDDLYEQI